MKVLTGCYKYNPNYYKNLHICQSMRSKMSLCFSFCLHLYRSYHTYLKYKQSEVMNIEEFLPCHINQLTTIHTLSDLTDHIKSSSETLLTVVTCQLIGQLHVLTLSKFLLYYEGLPLNNVLPRKVTFIPLHTRQMTYVNKKKCDRFVSENR